MKKGFTLVELIVVVIVIGILAAVGIPQYRKALERARGAEAYAGLSHIQQAEKIYYATNEHYLVTTGDSMTAAEQQALDISLPQTGWNFTISSTEATENFTATATRKTGQGPCSSEGESTITMTEAGGIATDLWKLCVDNL